MSSAAGMTETQAADTALADAADELLALAWTEGEPARLRRPRGEVWRWLAAVVLVCAALAAVIVLCVMGYRVGGTAPSSPAMTAAATATATVTVTTTVPSAPVAAEPALRPDDQRFLAMLRRDGFPDSRSVPDTIAAAGDVCRMVKRGDDFGYIESQMMAPKVQPGFTLDQAGAFLADALSAYCPHAAMN